MQNASVQATLSARGLKRTLGSGGERFEIFVPEIDIVAGEVTAIVGESGAGKSTLLDMLALISAPDSAERMEIAFGDRPPIDASALWSAGDEAGLAELRRRIGLVLQTGGLLPYLDIRGNAELARTLAGRRSDPKKITGMAEELGLAGKLGARPASLSGGERQRAAILRALAHEPALLVADEPTAAVDRERAEIIMQELARQAAQQGVACVVVSHDIALLEKIAHRLYRIEVERGDDGVSRARCEKVGGGQGQPAATGAAATEQLSEAGGGGLLLPARLAAKDLFSDVRFSFASIAAMAAVIAPLLLLLGLKQGVVEHQVERLVQDPRAREMTPLRAVSLESSTIERWRARPEVAFVTPGIARGASGVVVKAAGPAGGFASDRLMDLLATEAGDPLLLENGSEVPGVGEVALTHSAAVSLARGGDPGQMLGQKVELLVTRRSGGQRQVETARVEVIGVLDPRADPLERLYAPFDFLTSVESYRASRRDDLTWRDDGTSNDAAQRYRGFRLYARTIHDVEPLHQSLAAEGVEAAARLGPIRSIQEIDRALSLLLALVSVIAISGALFAMAANLVSMVERKRGEIALLRMMGMTRGGAFGLPIASAVLIAAAATLLAIGLYASAAGPINFYLAEALPFGERISRLSALDMGLALLAACAAAAICAVFAARRAARVEPAAALRRE